MAHNGVFSDGFQIQTSPQTSAIIEFQDGTLPDKDLRIDNWYMMAVFAASFALLAVEFVLRLFRARHEMDEEASAATKAGF